MRMLPLIAATTALGLSLTGQGFAETVLAPAQITVVGEASVPATPDVATVSLGVTTQADSAVAAMDANTAALNAVLERLKSAGIEDRDLQTANLSINPNWTDYSSGSGQKIVGYTVSNILNVRVRALDSLGTVLGASIGDGANSLNGITFEVAAPRPLQDEARRAAVMDARARAELYADAAGVKLGAVLSISEVSGYGAPQPVFYADAKSAAPVPIAAGQIALQASVTVVYALEE